MRPLVEIHSGRKQQCLHITKSIKWLLLIWQCKEPGHQQPRYWPSSQGIMMTSSNGNIFHVTGLLCGEFTGHRWIPCTKASDVELWCFLWSAAWINGCVNTDEWGWWFEMPSCPLWRRCNVPSSAQCLISDKMLFIFGDMLSHIETDVQL